jgi:hypothetical protein
LVVLELVLVLVLLVWASHSFVVLKVEADFV